jgi:serine/threonine protein kinase
MRWAALFCAIILAIGCQCASCILPTFEDDCVDQHDMHEGLQVEPYALSQVSNKPVKARESSTLSHLKDHICSQYLSFRDAVRFKVSKWCPRIPTGVIARQNGLVPDKKYLQAYSQRYAQPSSSLEIHSNTCLAVSNVKKECEDTSLVLQVYQGDTQDVQYRLTEPLHLKLGLGQRHAIDFAYTPIEYWDAAKRELEERQNPNGWWSWWLPRKMYKRDSSAQYSWNNMPFAGGSHGDVWRGHEVCEADEECADDLVFKRLRVQRGYPILEAGLREVYFGGWLAGRPESSLFTRYVDHFFREVSGEFELWIVFENAGPSLRSFLYTAVDSGDYILYEHSWLWLQLRQSLSSSFAPPQQETLIDKSDLQVSRLGRDIMRQILRQLLEAAMVLHEHGMVHRDIKPSNILCQTNINASIPAIPEDVHVQCVLADFSSAWDAFSHIHFYTGGPSKNELTMEYMPPEVVVGDNKDLLLRPSYDSWSIGIVALEMLLGTPNVFSVDQRTRAIISNKMLKQGASESDIKRALYL